MKYLVETGKIMDVVTPEEMAHGFATQRHEIDAILRQELEGVKPVGGVWFAPIGTPYVFTVAQGFALSVLTVTGTSVVPGGTSAAAKILQLDDPRLPAAQFPLERVIGTWNCYPQFNGTVMNGLAFSKGAFIVKSGQSLVMTAENIFGGSFDSPSAMVGGLWSGILLPAEKLAQLYV